MSRQLEIQFKCSRMTVVQFLNVCLGDSCETVHILSVISLQDKDFAEKLKSFQLFSNVLVLQAAIYMQWPASLAMDLVVGL